MLLYAAKSHIGLVRPVNQDGYSVNPELRPYGFLVVADGMGGPSAGDIASKLAIETVTRVVQEGLPGDETDPAALLKTAVAAANQQILDAAQDVAEYSGMGTTLVAVLFDETKVVFAHVGDSRGYLLGDEGLHQVTRDHSLVAELVRRGQLTEEEALHHPQRNIVTRSLGTIESSESEVDVVEWNPSNVVCLCTDGLSNLVSAGELETQLRRLTSAESNEDVERVADALVALSLERGAPDNITLAIVVHRRGGVEQ